MVVMSHRRLTESAAINKLMSKYVAQGLSKTEAKDKAYKALRSGPPRAKKK